ncbi:MAG: EAL and modified HD-GYP domain-containing signal transduction protein [Gammaproteobacteria bacterium]|jgi:EAL and modified HD-GYP domain-containing signal transduction protein
MPTNYCSGLEHGGLSQFDGNRATANVIVNALTEIGLDRVVGPHGAYINFTDDLLLSDTELLLPKERVVIEILEDASINDELIAAVNGLAQQGYVFALDDFIYEAKWEPLIELASIIKIDVLALDVAPCVRIVVVSTEAKKDESKIQSIVQTASR